MCILRRIILLVILIVSIIALVIFFIRKKQDELAVAKIDDIKTYLSNIETYNKIHGNKCSIPYPIYYINLDRDVKRKTYMENTLSKISNNYTRIPGIFGKNIKNINQDTIQGINFVNKYPLNKSEIGCTLSHLIAIKLAYDNGDNIALICEDDLFIDGCSLALPLESIVEQAPINWELLKLVNGSSKKITGNPASPKFIPYDAVSGHWSCAAYLINRQGMIKILSIVGYNPITIGPDKIDPLSPAEGMADMYLCGLIITYIIMPPIFMFVANFPSTIHQEHVDEIHIPVLHQYLSLLNEIILNKQKNPLIKQ